MPEFERRVVGLAWQRSARICAALFAFLAVGPLRAQTPAPAQLLGPEQLDDLVAPVALYPDPLLGQVLVASTYPLEIVEASQWLQQNGGLQGQARMDAARQQNWDPSVQALVAFPDVVTRLSSDVAWTTALGNAFLAQQADVMNAVQRMRARAQANGRLASDAEQTVTTQSENGQAAIDIVPSNPQVIYVPEYNPEYIWGPPLWGYYPPLYYPAVDFGFGFYPGIYVGAFFGGWGGWGGWGWGPNWFNCTIFTNAGFFGRYGFHDFYGGYLRGGIWAHNPYHRLGVAYPNQRLGQRFGGNYIGRGGVFHAGAGLGARRAAGLAGGQFRGGQSFAGGQRFGGAAGASRGGAMAGGQFRGGQSFAGQRFGGAAGASRGGAMAGGQARGQSFAGGRGAGNWQRFGGAAGAARGGAMAGGQARGSQSFAGGSGGNWQRFGGANGAARGGAPAGGQFRGGQPFAGGGGSYRGSPSFRQTPNFGGGLRSAPSYGGAAPRSFGGGGARSFGGGGARSFGGGGGARSFGGGGGARSFGGGGGARSFGGGGGGARSFGGGGGSRGGGGHGGRR